EPEIVNGLGFQDDVLALDGDLLVEAMRVGEELLLDQHAQGCAVPIVSNQQVMRAADGAETRAEPLEEILDRARARRRLPRDGMDHREQILRAMGQLPEQEAKLILVGLPFADVDRDGGRSDRLALSVPQRLDHQIERALPPEQLEIRLELLR